MSYQFHFSRMPGSVKKLEGVLRLIRNTGLIQAMGILRFQKTNLAKLVAKNLRNVAFQLMQTEGRDKLNSFMIQSINSGKDIFLSRRLIRAKGRGNMIRKKYVNFNMNLVDVSMGVK